MADLDRPCVAVGGRGRYARSAGHARRQPRSRGFVRLARSFRGGRRSFTEALRAVGWRGRFALPGVALTLLLALLAVRPAFADGASAGVIAGTVANKTGGDKPAAGMAVTLRIYQNENYVRDMQTKTDASGRFQFTGLNEDPAYQYLPVVDYQNVTYVGTPARFQDQQSPTGHDDVAIYETTADDPGLRYENATLVLGGVDQQKQHLSFFELLTLDNPSDRTFVPSAPAQGMPKNLLRFGLPAGVDDIGVQSGLDLNRLIEVDRGLASTAPVTPGSHTISFSFAVPYDHGAFNFAWPLVYPAAAVHILEPTSGATLQAAGLAPEPDLMLDGHTFHVLGRGAADASTVIDVSVTGLPDRTFLQEAGVALGRQGTVAVIGIAGAVAAALVPIIILLRRRGKPAGPAAPASGEALLDAIAALDDAHERGEIAEEPYQRQRAALKEQLGRLAPPEAVDAAQP